MTTLRARLEDRARLLSRSVQLLGVRATARRSLELLLRERPDRDRSFDARHGTDTSGRVPPAELGIEDTVARTQAVVYLPSPARVTRQLLAFAAPGPHDWAFMDLGSGKGRVVLVAAERPFRSVAGVELSPHLHQVAQRNLQRYRGPADLTRVTLQLGDARSAPLPEGDTLLHLYHPFGAPILRELLRRLEASLIARPRRLRIVYLGAFVEAMMVFAEFRYLTQVHFETCLEPKYSWAVFDAASGARSA